MESVEFITEVGSDHVIRPPAGTAVPEGTVRVVVQKQISNGPAATDIPIEEHPLYRLMLEVEANPPDLPPDFAEQQDCCALGKKAE